MKSQLILFLTMAFGHLDCGLVRKEVGRLISVGIWENVSEGAREEVFQEYISVRKAWNGSNKRFSLLEEDKKGKVELERSWLFSVVLDFVEIVEGGEVGGELYIMRFLEFLITIVSQLPTRRYVNTLLKDINLIALLKCARNGALDGDELIELLKFYINFPFDDFLGEALSEEEVWKRHGKKIKRLQLVAFKKYPKLKVLALSNFSSIHNRIDLEEHLSVLTMAELIELAGDVGIRWSYPEERRFAGVFDTRDVLVECFVEKFEQKRSIRELSDGFDVFPDENILSSSILDGSSNHNDILSEKPLSSYKLSLQYLSVEDFLIRSFSLWKLELMYQIRTDLINVATRLKPRMVKDEEDESKLFLDGWSRMAARIIDQPVVLDISPPLIGTDYPGNVRVEVKLDLVRVDNDTRKEWDLMRPGEVVFLARFETADPKSKDVLKRLGLKYFRCGELVRVLDERDKEVRTEREAFGKRRKLHVDIDSKRYVHDNESLVHGFNVVIRRRTRENNFKPVLESVKRLLNSDVVLPNWLIDVFLGFGNPTSATSINKLSEWVNFGYTFQGINHIKEVLPGCELVDNANDAADNDAQYNLRENDVVEISRNTSINDWKRPNNNIRFTQKQVESIYTSVHKGLTLVVGPPGTGKTDVATQTLNVLYHNYPNERILVITHSNQALNHIFEKLTQLGIPDHRLLRLGRGEESLETSSSFSKLGRIEHILQSRVALLGQVDKLVELLGVDGEYGDSCETALEFFSAYVKPAWEEYKDSSDSSDTALPFPFEGFSDNTNNDEVYFEICQLFEKLASIRPYELLSSNKQKSNYLLTHESRIVAMTSTYACMNRQEIIDLGFKYNTVLIEECAQITEIETFIPLTMQNDINNLERLILIGDHHQNAPIIQHPLLSQQANLNQSLFSRFIRLGVPVIQLDSQGRSRPQLANLYNWIYKNLNNLPHTIEYPSTNPGLLHTYQFINIADYNDTGETEPSPHFFQNLAEAEYAVALYQYMRLLNYPKQKISILATYYGQKVLIEEILKKRCTNNDINNKIFGSPAIITTVDQYQGEENDYIILSLVRTKSIGYLRDIRRLTVALSRAKLGLYILGRKELFQSNPTIGTFTQRLLNPPNDDLMVVPGELYNRPPISPRNSTPMQGLAHLGQYVHEMTQKRYEYES